MKLYNSALISCPTPSLGGFPSVLPSSDLVTTRITQRRVRAHSAACVTNYMQDAEWENYSGYKGLLKEELLNAFHSGPLYVQEQVIATWCE